MVSDRSIVFSAIKSKRVDTIGSNSTGSRNMQTAPAFERSEDYARRFGRDSAKVGSEPIEHLERVNAWRTRGAPRIC